MTDALEERARAILLDIQYLTIATSSLDGEPWNSPVYCSFDEQGNFYWASDPASRHSANLATNPLLVGVVYDSTAPAGTGEGVYLKARAELLHSSSEVARARTALLARLGLRMNDADDFTASRAISCYRATPTALWINGIVDEAGVYVKDCRVELPLEVLHRLATWLDNRGV